MPSSSPTDNLASVSQRCSRRRLFTCGLMSFIAVAMMFYVANPAFAQLPAGTTAWVTIQPVVTETVTDPLTGQTSTVTVRETILDIKHEDMPQLSGCTGDLILINGHARIVMRTSTADDGSVVGHTHLESAGTGLGTPSGSKYTYNSTSQSKSQISSTSEGLMIVAHDNLIRQREQTLPDDTLSDDFWMRTNLHVTFGGGQPKPGVMKIDAGCR